MLLDEYLNYLHESEDSLTEGKFSVIKKVGKFLKDPLKSKAYLKAAAKHKRELRRFQREYTGSVAAAKKLKTAAGRKGRYAKIKAGQGLTAAERAERAQQIRNIKRLEKHKSKVKTAMKRRKKLRTYTGIGGVGAVGFYGAKKADKAGQSL